MGVYKYQKVEDCLNITRRSFSSKYIFSKQDVTFLWNISLLWDLRHCFVSKALFIHHILYLTLFVRSWVTGYRLSSVPLTMKRIKQGQIKSSLTKNTLMIIGTTFVKIMFIQNYAQIENCNIEDFLLLMNFSRPLPFKTSLMLYFVCNECSSSHCNFRMVDLKRVLVFFWPLVDNIIALVRKSVIVILELTVMLLLSLRVLLNDSRSLWLRKKGFSLNNLYASQYGLTSHSLSKYLRNNNCSLPSSSSFVATLNLCAKH